MATTKIGVQLALVLGSTADVSIFLKEILLLQANDADQTTTVVTMATVTLGAILLQAVGTTAVQVLVATMEKSNSSVLPGIEP